jgi:hypothetical protein
MVQMTTSVLAQGGGQQQPRWFCRILLIAAGSSPCE